MEVHFHLMFSLWEKSLWVCNTNLAAYLFANANSLHYLSMWVEWGLEQTLVDEFSHVICLMAQPFVTNHTRIIAPAWSM